MLLGYLGLPPPLQLPQSDGCFPGIAHFLHPVKIPLELTRFSSQLLSGKVQPTYVLLLSLPAFIPVTQAISKSPTFRNILYRVYHLMCHLDPRSFALYLNFRPTSVFTSVCRYNFIIPWNINGSCHPKPSSLSRSHSLRKSRIFQIRHTTNKGSLYAHNSS